MKDSKKKKSETVIDKKRDLPREKTYISKEVETSITILESPEISVVTEALLYLSKYADLKDENLIHLQKKGILPKLLSLLKKPIPIIRLSLRLISLLLSKNDAVYEMDNEKNDDVLLEINDMFINNPDDPTKEFCAGILAKMAKSTRIVLLIFKSDLYTPIFHLLKTSSNAVLLANVLELFYNLLDAPTAISILPIDKAFDPSVLIERMKEFDHNMTQWILQIFKKLTYVGVDQIMYQLKECRIVESMFKILFEQSRAPYYPITFEIIANCLQNPITSSYFVESIEFLEFCKWSKYCSGTYLLPCAIILEKITNIPAMKQMLFDLSVEDSVLYLLRSKDKKVLAITCSCISNLTTHRYCCDKMLTQIVIREILRLMEIDKLPTSYNEIAVETIYNFCKRNSRTMNLLEAYNGIGIIMKYFHAGLESIPPKTYQQILEMVILVIATPPGQHSLMTPEFFTTLIKGFQFDYEETNLLCLELMTYCINQKSFRDTFMTMGGFEVIMNLLKFSKSKTLFKNILIFVHNALVYRKMAEIFLSQNLFLVLKNFPKEIQEEVPLIRRCLNLLYSLFLPLKFFETGKLDVCDKLKNRFYLITLPWEHPFPCLEVLESHFMCTSKVIYLVDYRVEKSELSNGSSTTLEKRQSKTSKRSTSTQILSISSRSQTDFDPFKLASDPYLMDYILYMRKHLTNDLSLEDQVKVIAIFVDAQLCGPREDYSQPQKLHSFRLHVESLKKKLETNIIPIGYLKIGFRCERSLLFKAICDKVCIPCTLVRSNESNYWNEVPLIRPGHNKGNLQYYVVDLMEHIGELYYVGSRDANCYCKIN